MRFQGREFMELIFEQDTREQTVIEIAKKMMTAARTAPKARGIDHTVIALVTGDGIKEISEKMKAMIERDDLPAFFSRDAENILAAQAMILFGTRISTIGLPKCGMCGFGDCDGKQKYPDAPCAFNTGDLGIAIGSAVAVAMDHRIDNRIMYTAGQAVLEMGLLGPDVKVAYAVPLATSSKNPFFDRKNK